MSIKELIYREGEEQYYGEIHHRAHQLPYLFVIFQEVRRFFSVKVADLEQDYRLYKSWTYQDELIEVIVRYNKGISDKDCEL